MMNFPYLETRYDKENENMAVWIPYRDMDVFIELLSIEVCECSEDFELILNKDCLYINMWKWERGDYRKWIKDCSKISKTFKKMYEED